QEGLTNIAKHSGAHHVVIEMTEERGGEGHHGYLDLDIQDDGCGFDVDGVEPNGQRVPARSDRGFGLLGIRERVKSLGGSSSITSEKGIGTKVRIRIPLNHLHQAAEKGASHG